MGFLSRLMGKEVPQWCSFFSPAQYKEFRKVVGEQLTRAGVRYRDKGDHIDLYTAEQPMQWGLENTAQLCFANPEKEWPDIVSRVLTSVLSGADANIPEDLEVARPSLKLRLYPYEMGVAPDFFQNAIHYSPADGLRAIVCFDTEDRVISLGRDQIKTWGLTDDELIAISLQNVLTSDMPERETIDLDDGLQINTLVGDSFFTASHALRLSNYLPENARHGALVVVPSRHVVVFHTILDSRVIPAVTGLIGIAQGRFREGPGSISPNLYWSLDDKLINLPYRLEKQKLIFTPPEHFGEVVRVLPKHAPEPDAQI